MLSFVVIANRRHTDLFEWGATQRAVHPPRGDPTAAAARGLHLRGGAFTLSAWLEPAGTIGGDTFDYSLARDLLHLSLTDAMGHGVASALTATLGVGSLRNTRRHGLHAAGAGGRRQPGAAGARGPNGPGGFVTGLLGRLDLRTGTLAMVNAGHVPPYLYRAGTVDAAGAAGEPPFGMFADAGYQSTDLVLRAGRPAGAGHRRHARARSGDPRPGRPRSRRPARSILARPRAG